MIQVDAPKVEEEEKKQVEEELKADPIQSSVDSNWPILNKQESPLDANELI